jgi:hypothetical protein
VSAISFTAHWPLWLLALLPLLWWVSLRSRSTLSRRHLTIATVLRSAAFVLVVLALLQPVWTAAVTQVSVVYALDVSRSVASEFVQSALQFAQRANREALPAAVRYVVFADQARIIAAPRRTWLRSEEQCTRADRTRLYTRSHNLGALDQSLLGLDPARVSWCCSPTVTSKGDVWRAVPHLTRRRGACSFPATPQTQADAWSGRGVGDIVRRDEPVA